MIRLFLILFIACYSCAKSSAPVCFQGIEMTMPYRILIGHSLSDKENGLVKEIISDTFNEINMVYNNWNPYSEISKINNSAGPFSLSDKLTKFFEIVDYAVKITDGRFDPTIGPILERETLQSDMQVGWKHVYRDGCYLKKGHPSMTFDFCGIAKGYCLDLLSERLQRAGFKNLFIEWAGEIKASGMHPQNRPWWIQIRMDSTEGNYPMLPLNDVAIATSCEDISYLKELNLQYSHVANPKEKSIHTILENSVYAVSVQAKSCALADALATAGLTFETEQQANRWAKNLAKNLPNLTIWMMKKENQKKE